MAWLPRDHTCLSISDLRSNTLFIFFDTASLSLIVLMHNKGTEKVGWLPIIVAKVWAVLTRDSDLPWRI